jgi:hypothetical protein
MRRISKQFYSTKSKTTVDSLRKQLDNENISLSSFIKPKEHVPKPEWLKKSISVGGGEDFIRVRNSLKGLNTVNLKLLKLGLCGSKMSKFSRLLVSFFILKIQEWKR